MLSEVLCDSKTKDQLGDDGMTAVTARLWPRDCQTCGRALGRDRPALSVDDVGDWAVASLHHPGCRHPEWNDGSVIFVPEGAPTTWTSVSFMLPATRRRKPDPRPAVLVNPSLEMVFLEPTQGRWKPGYGRQFLAAGMVPPGRELRLERPLPGLSAWVASDFISVSLTVPPETIYEATAPAEVAARAARLRQVLFMVTHVIDPAELYAERDTAALRIAQLLESREVICGCAAVSES